MSGKQDLKWSVLRMFFIANANEQSQVSIIIIIMYKLKISFQPNLMISVDINICIQNFFLKFPPSFGTTITVAMKLRQYCSYILINEEIRKNKGEDWNVLF